MADHKITVEYGYSYLHEDYVYTISKGDKEIVVYQGNNFNSVTEFDSPETKSAKKRECLDIGILQAISFLEDRVGAIPIGIEYRK